ncbi:flagellar biosynthetic protein FliO [Alloalcanivorax gelatiniphagus]|uniref:Flagellar protein n=2 Tax=Alloalcanivorax gelatiniphagus TaxID=1194167 RepID=A0ABY2XGJ8_9GAMM|nr:flagellar biosynthetic protein FliO [Alloalcanivorax gelatiniphagus]TMW10451.1 flagellar biosynthetic protein FliO [Alloalcanivorax gelatiniphagus]
MSTDAARDNALQAVSMSGGGEAMLGMAALGKTALVLLLLVGVILLCGWLLRRLTPGQGRDARRLTVVASRAVGPKERVVVVDVDGTRLVLGVGGGRVNRLHHYPVEQAPPLDGAPQSDQAPDPAAPFAARFAQALKQNLRGGRQ